jgi:hypothetical protein
MNKRDNGEHRLSHWVDQLLDRILLEPCWYTAQDHSGAAIGGSEQAQMNWRQKQKWMGVKPSQLDWRIYQSPVYAEIELKYGRGGPTNGQEVTMQKLLDRGIPTGCCWTIADFYRALKVAGFRLHANADNIVIEIIERHAAAERAAAVKVAKPKSGTRKMLGPRPTPGEVGRAEALRRRILY